MCKIIKFWNLYLLSVPCYSPDLFSPKNQNRCDSCWISQTNNYIYAPQFNVNTKLKTQRYEMEFPRWFSESLPSSNDTLRGNEHFTCTTSLHWIILTDWIIFHAVHVWWECLFTRFSLLLEDSVVFDVKFFLPLAYEVRRGGYIYS